MSVASRHDSGTTELVVPTAAAAEANCPSGRSSRPEQVSSRVLPPAASMFETHMECALLDGCTRHTRQLELTGGHRVQVRRKSSVTKRSHSPAVRAPPGKLSADFIQRHAANVSEKIKAGNRSLLPRARGPRATSLEKENLKNMKVGAVLPSRASPSADLSADSAGTDDTVESSSVGAMANAIALKHLTAQDEKAITDKIEFDDGQSTDITSEMLLECVRKEGAHDDLSQMLAADLSGRKIALINRLKDCHKLRLLDLSYNRISSTRGLDSLHQLRELRLTCNRLTSIFEINKLSALEHLHLQVNRISEISKASLRDNKKLKTLRLDGNALRKLQHLDGQVVLQHFDASQNQICKIEGLGMMGQLESLSLSYNLISKIEGLHALGWLRELDLSNNKISEIENLKQCGQLQILRLDDNQIKNLDGLTRLPHMVELYLNNNHLTRAAPNVLKMCPALEFLHLAGNQLAELSEVHTMGGLTNLIDLRLAENPLITLKGYKEHVKLYLSHVDTLDDEDVRGVRAMDSKHDNDVDHKQTLVQVVGVEEEDALLTDQVLDRGGVVFGKARDFGAKELAEVVPIEDFEAMLRGLRDGISHVRQDLHDSMYRLMFPPERDKEAEARKEAQRLREMEECEARMAARAEELKSASLGKYGTGDAAVKAVLARRASQANQSVSRGAPSLKSMMDAKMAKDLAFRERTGYHAPVQPGKVTVQEMAVEDAGPNAEENGDCGADVESQVSMNADGAPVQAMMGGMAHAQSAEYTSLMQESVVLPASMRFMMDALDMRMAATTDALQMEINADDDVHALSPRHPAPDSPTPFPTKDQREEWHRMVSRHPCRLCPVFHPAALDSILTNCMLQVEAREEEKVRAHTAASDMQREVENDQHDKFVANVLAGEPERPETPHMRPASPCVGQTSPEHKPFRTTTPFKGERVSTPAKGQMDNDFGGQRRSNAAESTAGVRRSCDPESWETAHKRLVAPVRIQSVSDDDLRYVVVS